MPTGRVHQISVSRGGVPKRAIDSAHLTSAGLAGDAHNDTRRHGGPDRAVCLFSLEVIEQLRAEGHPIAPGTAGENLTLRGLEWSAVVPQARLLFEGGVEVEIVGYTAPCSTIRHSFLESDFRRIKQELHPGQSRVYARVVREGRVEAGAGVELVAPPHAPPSGA